MAKANFEDNMENLEKIVTELEKGELNLDDSISKFEEAGFLVEKCVVDAELDTKKNNAGIHSINVRITGSVDEGQLAKTIKMLAEEYEIEESKIKVSIK